MLCAAAVYPVVRFGGQRGLQAMLLGAGLSWMTVVGSYVGLVVAFREVRQLQVVVVIGGFVVRLALLVGLLMLISKTLAVDLGQLVIWLVGFYIVLVVAEAYSLAKRPAPRPEA